ncbi:MAG: GMC family oxidoreductase [Pyrinomonadaceae bacterium]|nr:GMC family oxidoreductase [Pyrinomonadaceae bacterium]
MAGTIIEGRNVNGSQTVAPDFCVVGSGAGGGVCALKLAEAGFDVLVLEEGTNIPRGQGHGDASHVRPTFTERELDMYKMLYQEGGGRTSADGGVKVMQGRCLGGGTTVNWSACLPPPRFTLDHWRQSFGLPFTRENLDPYLVETVNFLHINANDRYNTSAQALIRGCTALGYRWSNLPNNTHHCRECGSCGVGCPYDRKQSGIVTWLPAAIEKGANIYTDTKVERLVRSNGTGRVAEVQAIFLDAKTQRRRETLTVRPRRGVVLAAGAIGTPAILLRSRINPNEMVGKTTHIHPVTICIGKYSQQTHPAYGVPDNMMTDQFAAGAVGYLIETGSFYPVLSAASTLDHGDRLRQIMRDYYPHGAIMYAHHCSGFDTSQPYGTVRLDRYGDPELEYKLDPANVRAMRHSLKEMTRIHLSAGAASVYHVTNPSLEISSTNQLDLIDSISFAPQRTTIFTVHVMGGARMGADARRSVVSTDFSLRDTENVWVADGSVFPTGLGANPQVTIYALALRAAEEICRRHDAPFTLHQQDRSTFPWQE